MVLSGGHIGLSHLNVYFLVVLMLFLREIMDLVVLCCMGMLMSTFLLC